MTQEEKELLLKDLCGRLPYGLKVNIRDMDYPVVVQAIYSNLDVLVKDMYCYSLLFECKPYLRPLSSMTEDEKKEAKENGCIIYLDTSPEDKGLLVFASPKGFDWLNAHHFDCRGLIEKDIALEAPEGMYDTSQKWTTIRSELKENENGQIVGGLKL